MAIMPDRNLILLIAVVIFVVLAAWAPWITKEYAEQRVIDDFESSIRAQIDDGCRISCHECGVKTSSKELFGYNVLIQLECGPTEGLYSQETKFVSFLGTVH